MLNQIRIRIDNVLLDANNTISQIANNNRLIAFLQQKQPLNNFNHYEIHQLTQDLIPYAAQKPFLTEIFIYCFNNDIVLCPGAVYPARLFYERKLYYKNTEFAEWRSNLEFNLQGRKVKIENPVIDGKDRHIIFLTQTLPITSLMNNLGIILIAIDEQEIKNILTSNAGGYIINQSGEIFLNSMPPDELPVITPEYLQDNSGFFRTSFKGKKLMVSYASSQITDWKYINIENEEIFLEKVHYFSRNFIITLILCGIFGILLSYYLSKKNYSPINRIVQFIKSSMHTAAFKDTENEMDFIRDVFINSVRNNARMEEEIQKLMLQISQKEKTEQSASDSIAIADNIIATIMQSSVPQNMPALQNFLQFYGIVFEYKNFMTMLVKIEDSGKFISPKTEANDRRIIYLAIKSVIEELLKNGSHYGYAVHLENEIMGVLVNLNIKKDTGGLIEEINSYAEKLCNFLSNNFYTAISIGMGRICSSLDEVNSSYQDAKSALDFRFVKEQRQIIWYNLSNRKNLKSGNSIKNEALVYIHSHYTDKNFSQKILADALKISPQYLSKIFKEETGCNMVEYVNRLRIDHAKQLLADFTLSETIIAARIGYTNDKTLIRVFKQYEKITPGQYRTMINKKKPSEISEGFPSESFKN